MEQSEAVVDVETADGEVRRAAEPHVRLRPQLRELTVLARPGEIDVGRPYGFRVVMGQKRCVLVSPLAGSLEPARKCGVQPRASRSWQAVVGNLASQRMLD